MTIALHMLGVVIPPTQGCTPGIKRKTDMERMPGIIIFNICI
jgi:hypothetical protein